MPADNFAVFFVGDNMEIWTDASFDQHRKVAGWGIVVQDGMKERTYSNWFPVENINLAEMFAIHTACVISGGRQCTIYTDSQTALAYINQEVTEKQRTPQQQRMHVIMKTLAAKIRRFNCQILKIKAHQRNMQMPSLNNHQADISAKKGLGKFYLTLDRKRVR